VLTEALWLVRKNPAAIARLGTPISAGFPWGNIKVSGGSGTANLSFAATGPKGSGTVYLSGQKDLGTWRLTRFDLAIGDSGRTIDLGTDTSPLAPLKLPLN